MSEKISKSLRAEVEKRAGSRCEYCKLPQTFHIIPFQIDHVISLKHDGKTVKENLALACLSCNLYKGTDIASIAPHSSDIVGLFNPRIHNWQEHFDLHLASGRIEGKTPEGKATVALLKFNSEERILERLHLVELGEYLPV